MILRNQLWFLFINALVLCIDTQNQRIYDSNEWLPMAPLKNYEQQNQRKSTSRALNVDTSFENYYIPENHQQRGPETQQYLRETITSNQPLLDDKKIAVGDHPYMFEAIQPNEQEGPYLNNNHRLPVQLPHRQYQLNMQTVNVHPVFHENPTRIVSPQNIIENHKTQINKNPDTPYPFVTPLNNNNSFYQSFNPNSVNELLEKNKILNGGTILSSAQKTKSEEENVGLLYVPYEQLKQQFQERPFRSEEQYSNNKKPSESKVRLENIKQDFILQALGAQKLQEQFYYDKPNIIQTTPASKPKRKPHQPPLAIYMGGEGGVDVPDLLNILANAKTISVQDSFGPDAPQVFVGPSSLSPPEGYTKFSLPYLSSIDGIRMERKEEQQPFFVAPLNYKTPYGYSKIFLPSPHVGSIVISNRGSYAKPSTFSQLESENQAKPQLSTAFQHSSFQSTYNQNDQVKNAKYSGPKKIPSTTISDSQSFIRNTYSDSTVTSPTTTNIPVEFAYNLPPHSYDINDETLVKTNPLQGIIQKYDEVNKNKQSSTDSASKNNHFVNDAQFSEITDKQYASIIEESTTPYPKTYQTKTTHSINKEPQNTEFTPSMVYNVNPHLQSNINHQETIQEYQPTVDQYHSQETYRDNYKAPIELPDKKLFPFFVNNLQDQGVRSLLSPTLLVPTTKHDNEKYNPTTENDNDNFKYNPTTEHDNVKYNPTTEHDNVKYNPTTEKVLEFTEMSELTTVSNVEVTTRKLRGRQRGSSRFNQKTTTTTSSPRRLITRRRFQQTYANKNINASFSEATNINHNLESQRFRAHPKTSSIITIEPTVQTTTISYKPTRKYIESQDEFKQYQEPKSENTLSHPKTIEQSGDQQKIPVEAIKEYHQVYRYQGDKNFDERIPFDSRQQNGLPELHYREDSQPQSMIMIREKLITTVKPTRRTRIKARARLQSTTPIPKNNENGFFRQTETIQVINSPESLQPKQIVNGNEPGHESVQFIGEIRPKYQTSPTIKVTTTKPKTRGRVRISSRQELSNKLSTVTETSSTRRTVLRTRGKSHFKPPKEKTEDEDVAGGNYPMNFLKKQNSLITTTTTRPSFQITVEPNFQDDQERSASSNVAILTLSNETWVEASPLISNQVNIKNEKNIAPDILTVASTSSTKSKNTSYEPKHKFDQNKTTIKNKQQIAIPTDHFEEAESQNYDTVYNSIPTLEKVNPQQINQEMTNFLKNDLIKLSDTSDTSKEQSMFESLYEMFGFKLQDNATLTTTLPEIKGSSSMPLHLERQISNQTSQNISLTMNEQVTENEPTIHNYVTQIPIMNMDFIEIVTSTSTEINHETEICYKGKCVRSNKN